MNQITIVSACEVDGEGFRQRLQGRGIRDCILVLSPEGISLGLLHKESSNRTFVEDEILGREAALDIDSGRIATTDSLDGGDTKITENERTHGWDRPWRHDAAAKEKAVLRQKENVAKAEKLGRFPANLILMHDSECEKVGSRVVKGTFGLNEVGEGGQFGTHIYGSSKGRTEKTLRGYGTETVDNWECVEHCPVGRLDGQSGLLSSGAHTTNKKSEDRNTVFGKGLSGNASGVYFANSGGASRFFRQATSEEELEEYLQSMVRSK